MDKIGNYPTYPFTQEIDGILTTVICVCVVLLLNSQTTASSDTHDLPVHFYCIPGLNDEVYSQAGDINIGDIVGTSLWHNNTCQDSLVLSSTIPESTEPIKFAVDLINRNQDLLPNITFGFVIRAACKTEALKLATSLSYLPRTERICNRTSCDVRNMMTSDSKWLTHDVIGILSPEDSDEAFPIASLFSVARVPMLSYNTGSNELSRRFSYPYHFRMNTQDWYQNLAILRFASSMGWIYMSMVYTDDDYGRDAYTIMNLKAHKYGVCIAASHKLIDYDKIASAIVENSRARAIAVFLTPWRFKTLVQKVMDRNMSRHFIWIGSNALNGYNGYSYSDVKQDPGIGAFVVYTATTYIPAYYHHIRTLDILTTKNPWLKPIWEEFLSCSYDLGTCDTDADILKTRGYRPFKSALLRIDAVLTFAHAAHNLLQDKCPDAIGKEARTCITGESLLKYLKTLKFQGYHALVEFDSWDELEGNVTITQLTYDNTSDPFGWSKNKKIFEKAVAKYDSFKNTAILLDNTISWSHLNTVERIVPWTNGSLPIDIPESVCSRPCVAGEYKIEKDVPCCWDCVKCRDNERVADGNTGCEACPSFMWPDPTSDFTTCTDIPPSYQTMEDTIPIILVSITVVSLVITVITFVFYVIYRNERVIKASGRELSVIQLIAIFVGYSTVILFQATPTDAMCQSIFFQFCMSFSMLYSPLFAQTVRIYRNFMKGDKEEQPPFTSHRSQLLLSLFLVAFQFVLCGATHLLFFPGARRTQPILSEKMVELSCDFTLPGLASFLGFNILLVTLCAVVAFMVRDQSDKFYQSKLVSMYFPTTLLIWLAFIPTYLMADRQYIRVFLLCMVVLLNHSIGLVLLFVLVIYSARFVSS